MVGNKSLVITAEEYESLRSQFVTLKTGRGQHRKYLPYAFTEHGALMLGNVLKAIAEIISAIRQLMAPEEPKKTNEESFGENLPLGYVGAKKRPIGFAPWKEK